MRAKLERVMMKCVNLCANFTRNARQRRKEKRWQHERKKKPFMAANHERQVICKPSVLNSWKLGKTDARKRAVTSRPSPKSPFYEGLKP